MAEALINKENLALLFSVAKQINSGLELDDLLKHIMETASRYFRTETSSLLLIDRKTNELYFNKATEGFENISEVRVPMGRGIAGIVAQSGTPIIVNDGNDPRIFKEVDRISTMVTRNLVAVPLRVKERIIGVLEIMNANGRSGFSNDDLEMLVVFSDFAALAIDNRDLYDQTRFRVQQLAAIYAISQLVNRSDSRESLLKETISVLEKNTGSKRLSIILKDSEKGWRFLAGKNLPKSVLKEGSPTVGGNILEWVLENKRGLVVSNIDTDGRFGRNKKLRYHSGSFMVSPMFASGGESVAGFLCASEPAKNSFRKYDLEFLDTVAKEFYDAYTLLSLKSEVKEKSLLDAEVRITAKMQDEILPSRFPDVPKMTAAAASLPCKTVGGDFYDFVKKSNNEVVCIISDISGKGIPSTVFMAVCRTIFRMSLSDSSSPKAVLTKTNKSVFENSRSGMFATAFMASINLKTRRITWANAGHFEQYLFVYKTRQIVSLAQKSKPLGVLSDGKYVEKSLPFSSRDILLLFTDGIIEAVDKKNQIFGTDRLKEILAENYQSKPEEIKAVIIHEVKKFSRSKDLDDDLTLVVVKFT